MVFDTRFIMSATLKASYVLALPTEILLDVLQHLTLRDIYNIRSTCKQLKTVIDRFSREFRWHRVSEESWSITRNLHHKTCVQYDIQDIPLIFRCNIEWCVVAMLHILNYIRGSYCPCFLGLFTRAVKTIHEGNPDILKWGLKLLPRKKVLDYKLSQSLYCEILCKIHYSLHCEDVDVPLITVYDSMHRGVRRMIDEGNSRISAFFNCSNTVTIQMIEVLAYVSKKRCMYSLVDNSPWFFFALSFLNTSILSYPQQRDGKEKRNPLMTLYYSSLSDDHVRESLLDIAGCQPGCFFVVNGVSPLWPMARALMSKCDFSVDDNPLFVLLLIITYSEITEHFFIVNSFRVLFRFYTQFCTLRMRYCTHAEIAFMVAYMCCACWYPEKLSKLIKFMENVKLSLHRFEEVQSFLIEGPEFAKSISYLH